MRPRRTAGAVEGGSGRRAPVEEAAGRNWIGPALVLLGLAELAWLLWCLIVPLPYANNTDIHLNVALRRGLLLLKAFPHVVPDTTFSQSLLGRALTEMSHFENLPQRVPVALAAVWIAAAALGLGDLVLDRGLGLARRFRTGERLALDYGLGAALLGALTLIVGRLGWLGPWPARIGLGTLALLGGASAWIGREPTRSIDQDRCPERPSSDGPRAGPPIQRWLARALLAPFLLAMFLGAMLPTIDFDVMEYHLQGPKEHFLAGRIAYLPHNIYTNMPFGVEMLHLLGMEVWDDWWWGALSGQVLVAGFAAAAALLIASTACRIGSPRAGWLAALVYLSTPWIYRLAAIAYVEGPLCYYHAALVFVLIELWTGPAHRPVLATGAQTGPGAESHEAEERADGPSSERVGAPVTRAWWLLGLLAGGAMGCKYPGLISAVLPFGALALAASCRKRTVALVLAFSAGWAVVMGPWLIKNAIDTGDPVYPLGYQVFHGRDWDDAMQQKWQRVHGPRPITAGELGSALVDVAGRSDWQSPLYLALAPLALVRRRSRPWAWALLGYVAYLFATWWLLTHRLDRFWLPLLPSCAVLAGLGGDWTRGRAWSLMLGALLAVVLTTNLSFIATDLAGLSNWTDDLGDLRRQIPRRINAPLTAMDEQLPDGAKVLLVGQAAVFYVNHPIVYNTVFNVETIEALASGRTPSAFHEALHARNITHVYVDWFEIERHRKPGGYGFTPFVTRERFAEWVADGVLEGPRRIGEQQDLYRVGQGRAGP